MPAGSNEFVGAPSGSNGEHRVATEPGAVISSARWPRSCVERDSSSCERLAEPTPRVLSSWSACASGHGARSSDFERPVAEQWLRARFLELRAPSRTDSSSSVVLERFRRDFSSVLVGERLESNGPNRFFEFYRVCERLAEPIPRVLSSWSASASKATGRTDSSMFIVFASANLTDFPSFIIFALPDRRVS